MTLTVINDTEEDWHARYLRKGRMNGAKSYTSEIIKYQLPILESLLNATVSTTGLFSKMKHVPDSNLYIQYLHTYPLVLPLDIPRQVQASLNAPVIFITSYKSFANLMNANGFEAIFIPMTIDPKGLPSAEPDRYEDRMIYFGNVTTPKETTYKAVKRKLPSYGYTVDTISNGYFNGSKKVNQKEAWNIIAKYKYSLGVGRCAMEATAIGTKNIIVGNRVGGIVTSLADHQVQTNSNYNARVVTYDNSLESIIANLDNIAPLYNDIHDVLPSITESFTKYLKHK